MEIYFYGTVKYLVEYRFVTINFVLINNKSGSYFFTVILIVMDTCMLMSVRFQDINMCYLCILHVSCH